MSPLNIIFLVFYVLILAALSLYGAHRWFLLLEAQRYRRRPEEVAAALPDPLPRVTVQLPIFNERYVIVRLLRAVARLDYPAHLLEIQVLDDSDDGSARRVARLCRLLARRGLRVHHLHRHHREGFKAGALAAGLARATGEFIAVFDADFLPPAGFLKRTLHAFSDARVGMVQARWGHANRRRSLLTRAQAAFLDGHFLVEHFARHRGGRFFNFNGTAGVWRRRCIEDAGGWQALTLTEDLDLSYRAQLAGWRFVFLPQVVAPAELPGRMSAFKSQQHRWAKGSAETVRLLLGRILRSPLPLRIRLEAFFHLTGNCAYVLMTALMLALWPAIRLRQGLAHGGLQMVDLAVFLMASVSVAAFYIHGQRQAGRSWGESVISVPLVMGFGVGLALNNGLAVLDGLAARPSPFVRTPKDGGIGTRLPPGRRYLRSPGWLPALEALMALYLLAALVDALRLGLWAWVPFLVIFAAGLGMTASLGLRDAFLLRRA